jgi:hypothetical protein
MIDVVDVVDVVNTTQRRLYYLIHEARTSWANAVIATLRGKTRPYELHFLCQRFHHHFACALHFSLPEWFPQLMTGH